MPSALGRGQVACTCRGMNDLGPGPPQSTEQYSELRSQSGHAQYVGHWVEHSRPPVIVGGGQPGTEPAGNKTQSPVLAGVAQWMECLPTNQNVAGSIPSHVGQVPDRGLARGNHTLMFLSLSLSFSSPLPKNK